MQNLIAVLYMAVYAFSGILIANAVFFREKQLVKLWLGGVIGLVMLLWFPALFSFLFGTFSLRSQILALVLSVALGITAYFVKKPDRTLTIEKNDALPAAVAILPLFLLSAYLLFTHTILPKDGALFVGQSTYGDLAMHLGFITSIAGQEAFPPLYSICPDAAIGYPFLSDSISSTFYQLGASLRFSTILPALYALLLVFSGAYAFFCAWLKQKRTAVFSSYLFFVGGGFGFWYFFDVAKDEPGKLMELMTAFYETPTNYVEYGMRWVNPIADMLIPQRATLFGWALLFACLYLLYRAAFCGERRFFAPLGVIAGALPLVHTHSFLALGIVSAFYLLRSIVRREGFSKLSGFLLYGLIAVALACPQLFGFTFQQSSGFLSFHWNWANVSDSFLWFYIKNWGLLFILLPAAFISLPKEDRGVFGGALCIWVIAELIQFQPNTYDNNKLLFVTFVFICGLVGKYMAEVFERLCASEALKPAGTYLLAGAACIALFLSGTLTLAREAVSEYELISAEEVQATDFIKINAEADATFLTANNHDNAVAVLTGRNIVCGSGTFLYFHGIDYSAREEALPMMYEEPSLYFDAMRERYGVDYVYIGDSERYNYDIDEDYFKNKYPLAYDAGGIKIYDVR